MKDKGYEHPLYSLDLLLAGVQPSDDPRFFIPHQRGRLVVRRELRLRGERLRSSACLNAVAAACPYQASEERSFAQHGFDADWVQGMRYWAAFLDGREAERATLTGARKLTSEALVAWVQQGQKLWGQLTLVSRLCGLGGTLLRGRAPRGSLQLLDELRRVALLAAEPSRAALLAQRGFGPPQQEQLQQVIAGLSPSRDEGHAHKRNLDELSAALAVGRGAIYGDLAQFSLVAQAVLPPEVAAKLRLQALFPQKRQRPAAPSGRVQDQAE